MVRRRIFFEHGPSFLVEVALSPTERARGLMFRPVVPEGTGMLFVFPDAREHTIWMRNTLVPLDVVFLGDDGRVVAIRHALETRSDRPTGTGIVSRALLELPLGSSLRNGLAVGQGTRTSMW